MNRLGMQCIDGVADSGQIPLWGHRRRDCRRKVDDMDSSSRGGHDESDGVKEGRVCYRFGFAKLAGGRGGR